MLLLDDYGPTGETGEPGGCEGEVGADDTRDLDGKGGM